MRKCQILSFFTGLCLFFLSFTAFADENQVSAANPSDNQSVSGKLDRIIDTQAEILKQLDEVKAELEIVKIRASRG